MNIGIDCNGPATDGGFATLVWEPVYAAASRGTLACGSAARPAIASGGWWSPANAPTR